MKYNEDDPSCFSGLLSRKIVEFAQRTEPEEWVERVGEREVTRGIVGRICGRTQGIQGISWRLGSGGGKSGGGDGCDYKRERQAGGNYPRTRRGEQVRKRMDCYCRARRLQRSGECRGHQGPSLLLRNGRSGVGWKAKST